MNRNRAIVAAVGIALASAIGPSSAAAPAFSDRSFESGLDYFADMMSDMSDRNLYIGGTVGDFDRDGWPDVFLLGGGGIADALFMNNGDGTFTDRAADWGVDALHRGRGATTGDFNGDGWPDIYVTSGGDLEIGDFPGRNRLYRNNGDGTFTNVAAAAGVNETDTSATNATGSAFGDYDLDGDLDLFVCGWQGTNGNRLFRNDGDGTFTDVTVAAGIGFGFDGFSPRFVDMNGDRYPELLIAADFVTSRYFLNDGDGTFTNITSSTGTGIEDNGMGSAIADFNHDGLPDWYVTSVYRDGTAQDGNHLYVNQGSDTYTVNPESSGARDGGWGWGVAAIDVDHDGWVDIVETNGWVETEFIGENAYVFRNNGDLTFTAVPDAGGLDHAGQGRSLLALDHDRDGDMDFLVTAFDQPVFFYRNDLSGPDTHWIEVVLDTGGHAGLAPDGYGSKVVVTVGGVSQTVWVDGGPTYLGRSQLVAHFGLGAATTVDQLRVEWADGVVTTLTGVAADQILTVTPSSGGGPGAPGEASAASLMTASWNGTNGEVDLSYAAACDATDHTIYYGDLADVASHTYSGAACGVGTSGAASFDPGPGSVFFVIVGTAASAEGSYGTYGAGLERPEDIATIGCDVDQDLTGTCTP